MFLLPSPYFGAFDKVFLINIFILCLMRASIMFLSQVHDLFEIFDTNGTGAVPFAEIMSGLSVLCDSPTGDKVAVSFLALDTDSQGTIGADSLELYVRSLLKVLMLVSPTARGQLMRNLRSSNQPSVLVIGHDESGELEMRKLIISYNTALRLF